MELLASIAAISSGLLVLFIVALVILALFSKEADSRPLLLDEALRRQASEVAYRAIASGGSAASPATRRRNAAPGSRAARATATSISAQTPASSTG
jgi:hypothetical protein